VVTFYLLQEEEGPVLKPRRVMRYDQEKIASLEKLEADTYPPSLSQALKEIYFGPEEVSAAEFGRVHKLEGEDLTTFENSARMELGSLISIAKFAYIQDSSRLASVSRFSEE